MSVALRLDLSPPVRGPPKTAEKKLLETRIISQKKVLS
jgi:hypothetical protein